MLLAPELPTAWYNALPDLGLTLPEDRPAPTGVRASSLRVAPALLRQEISDKPWIAIPDEVQARYAQWRPTPLRRAQRLEQAIGTTCRLYYKYEGGNLAGSHKLNTAVAQAFYYRRAGVRCLTIGTGAGQWGTAAAAACAMFGLDCRVFMVRSSLEAKPYRKVIMELLGAQVIPSPSDDTPTGRLAGGNRDAAPGSLAVALAEAIEAAEEPGVAFCTGSGESYALLHQTVIGQEVIAQAQDLDDEIDVVVASLGGGSNFGGLALPFLGRAAAGGRPVRCVSVESAACPKLTRGRYAYDYTDASCATPLQKMYTLGHTFEPPSMHAGGLRYHGASKLISALRHRGAIEAAAYQQRAVFESAVCFAETEGILPAPESAHAIHGAIEEARGADRRGSPEAIVMGISGHGLLDMAAYAAFADGTMGDAAASEESIARALAALPPQPVDDDTA